MEEQRNLDKRRYLDTAYSLIATVFGVGRLPLMPGTWGSLIVLPLYLLIGWNNLIFFIIMAFFLVISIPASRYLSREMKEADPSEIVIDEFAGQMITLLFLPEFGLKVFIIAFIIFRVCDIIKPPPANISQDLPHGWGVVLDDVFAGIYANLILQIVLRIV